MTDTVVSGGSDAAMDLLDDIEKDSSIALMDPSTMHEVLQAINGHAGGSGTVKERQIKRQRRGNRMKVYDNGYIFTYDKDSQCGQRSFWRCERKSECQARVHTNPATNQIIKRINEHTHEPPSREDLPPWLVLSQTTSDTSDDGSASVNGRESTTGILLNANYSSSSANTQLSSMVERELDSSEAPVNMMPVEMVKQEPLEHSASPPPKKRKRNSTKKEDVAGALELMNSNPEQFWEIYDLTKKTIKFIQDGGAAARSSPERSSVPCSSAVAEWLESHNLGEYKSRFSKYTMDALRQLSSSDCTAICQNDADGLLLFHSLRISPCTEASSSNSSKALSNVSFTVFIAPKGVEGEDEPLYQQISLHQKTPATLQSQMEQRGLIQSDRGLSRFCVVGPGGIKVELNEEMMAVWAPDSVFQFVEKKGGVCLLDRIS